MDKPIYGATVGSPLKPQIRKPIEEALAAAKASGDFKGDKGDAGSIKFTVVTELPAEDDGSSIFLVPSGEGEDGNAYDEYIYNNSAWEKIGSASVEVNFDEYVKNTDYATGAKAGVVKVGGGLVIYGDTLQIDRANESEIQKKQSSVAPITPVYLDRAVKTGVTTNTIALTDEEKTTACEWLGAIKQSSKERCLYGRLNGVETAYNVDYSNAANVNAIPYRALKGGIYIPSASIGASGSAIPVGQEAVNKKYVDDLVADVVTEVGNIDAALDELHAYAQALANGGDA